jgi:hypothetical protein
MDAEKHNKKIMFNNNNNNVLCVISSFVSSMSKLFIRCDDFLRWRYTKVAAKKANPIPYWPIPAEKERYKMTIPPVRMNSKEIISRLLTTFSIVLIN